jgi:CBS domain-containing protein
MTTTARELMTTDVKSVRPDMTLPDLERALLEARVGGFPVVEDGRLLGLVSRSDIVRQLCVEQSVAELTSGYQQETDVAPDASYVELIGTEVGRRMEGHRIEDVMIRDWIGVSPDEPIQAVARRMLEHQIHRLPVVDGDRLLGIITAFDMVRLVAEQPLESA